MGYLISTTLSKSEMGYGFRKMIRKVKWGKKRGKCFN